MPVKRETQPKVRDQDMVFVTEYAASFNATEAYLAAHPAVKSREVASAAGSRLLGTVRIRALLEEEYRKKLMSADEVLARLREMASASQYPFIRINDDDGAVYFNFKDPEAIKHLYLIRKLKTKRTRRVEGRGKNAEAWEDEWVEVELHDAQRALELIGRKHRLWAEQKDPNKESENTGRRLFIPVELIASSFVDLSRDILAGRHTEYVIKGGRGSTKSSFVSLAFICLLVNNPLCHGIALRKVANTLRDSVYAQLVWAIGKLDEYFPGLEADFKCNTSPLEIKYLPTHQKIYFRGADKPEKIKSIKTKFGHIGISWFEELDQFHGQEEIRKIEQSIFRGGEEAWEFKTYNPPKTAANWVNKYVIVPKDNQLQHHSTYLTVPAEWLGQTFNDEAEHLKRVNLPAYEHEYMGVVTGTGGMIFDNTEIREITDAEIAQFDQIHRGADWGFFPDPFSYGKMHYDAARLTLYIFDEYRAYRKGNRKVYDALVKEKGLQPSDLIIADSAEPKSIGDFREYGANIRGAEKGPDSVEYSYKWMQSLFKIVIDPRRAPKHAEEFAAAEFPQDKNGDFITQYPEKDNHGIDDTRYAMNLIWRQRGK